MHRIPMPRMSLLMVALGGAVLLGQQVAGTDLGSEPTVVLTVPAANVAGAGGGHAGHAFVADLHVDDAASATLR